MNSEGSTGYVAQAAKTGQTASYQDGDDGYYQKGIASVTQRFTLLSGIGCVIDNLTGLMWSQDINIAGETKTWTAAINYCEGLSLGGYTDWRMPNKNEMKSLIDYSNDTPALPTGHPFTGSKLTSNIMYFTSTTKPGDTYYGREPPIVMSDYISLIRLKDGAINDNLKSNSFYIFPVRG